MIQIIKYAYDCGCKYKNGHNELSIDEIKKFCSDLLVSICKIANFVSIKLNEKKVDDGLIAKVLNNVKSIDGISCEIISKYSFTNNEFILDGILDTYGIDKNAQAKDIELSIQVSFIKGFYKNNANICQNFFEKELTYKCKSSLTIKDWLISLINENNRSFIYNKSNDWLEYLRNYFASQGTKVFGIFSICNSVLLAEDGWVSKYVKGRLIRFEIKDETFFGKKEVVGGSYLFHTNLVL